MSTKHEGFWDSCVSLGAKLRRLLFLRENRDDEREEACKHCCRDCGDDLFVP